MNKLSLKAIQDGTWTLSERVPENPYLSSNGGDYAYAHDVYVLQYRNPVSRKRNWATLEVYSTSSEFPYCEAEGNFCSSSEMELRNPTFQVGRYEVVLRNVWLNCHRDAELRIHHGFIVNPLQFLRKGYLPQEIEELEA